MQKIKTQETHKSIPKDLEWNDIPRFAIITGKNGSGKSQLLEQMKDPKNWVDNSCTAKYIKHIPAIYNFNTNSNNSKSSIIDANNGHKNTVLNSFKTIIETDTKQYIKDNNVNILNLIDMMARYHNDTNLIHKNHSKEYAQLIQDDLVLIHLISPISQHTPVFKYVLEKSGKTLLEDITEEEFLEYFPQSINNDFTAISHLKDWFTVFIDDYDKKSGAANRTKNTIERERLENLKAPWVLMNDILKEYKFKYYIKDFDSSLNPLQIHFTENGQDIIPIEDLSSGEQQLISLVAWAHHEVIAQNIQVLLLDEPDAHLHPSFCKIFVEIMNKYIVKAHGIQVIMTTHSPSTIAYAPEESIFVMKMPEESDPTSRVMKQTKEKALSILSDGLMTITDDLVGVIGKIFNNKENNLFLVEGKTDKIHIEQCLLHDDELKKKFNNIILIDMGGVSKFETLHPFLRQMNRDKSNTSVLFDNDTDGNKMKKIAEKYFKVISLENGDIEVCTKLKDNADLFKEWIKTNYSILIDFIDSTKLSYPSGNEKEIDSLFTKYLKGESPKGKMPNPLNSDREEEATNVFKNLWCEYLKDHPELSKDTYQDLINLLNSNL